MTDESTLSQLWATLSHVSTDQEYKTEDPDAELPSWEDTDIPSGAPSWAINTNSTMHNMAFRGGEWQHEAGVGRIISSASTTTPWVRSIWAATHC
jgi:hypothetical protein